MIFSTKSRAVNYANEVGKPVFFVSYSESGFLTEEYWVEDADAEPGVFTNALANHVSAYLKAGAFNTLERL